MRPEGDDLRRPLKIVVRLVVFDTDRNIEPKPIRDIKEQEIYFGEIPLMTRTARSSSTYGAGDRQPAPRSPGIFFDHDKGKTLASGKLIYSARVIPIRGSWLDLEFDSKDSCTCGSIAAGRCGDDPAEGDGQTTHQILNYFYNVEKVVLEKGRLYVAVNDSLIGEKAPEDIVAKDGE